MGVIQDQLSGDSMKVDPNGSGHMSISQRGDRYRLAAVTGTMPAAIAANNYCFGMWLDPASTRKAFIHKVALTWYTVAAFTTPLTWGRRLALWKGSSATPFTGGTDLSGITLGAPSPDDVTGASSEFLTSNGGSTRISTTAVLGNTGAAFQPSPVAHMDLVGQGAAGAIKEQAFEFYQDVGGPLLIKPGEFMAIRLPQAMDAAGTWSLGVNAWWSEATG